MQRSGFFGAALRGLLVTGTSLGALAWSLVASTAAHAEPAAADGKRALTLDQALTTAKKANRSLAVERARLAEAETTLEQAWTVLFPTVTAQGKYTRNNIEFRFVTPPMVDATGNVTKPASSLLIQPVTQLDGAVGFSTLLFAPAVYPGLKAVKNGVEASSEGVRASEDAVLFGVAQSFHAAAIADEVLKARDSSITVSRATLEIARTRFTAGAVTKVDVDRAELAVLRAEQAKREAELGRRQSYRALATLIGLPEVAEVVPAPTAETSTDRPPSDLKLVLDMRPEFRALAASQRQADLEQTAYLLRWAPSIAAFGNARIFNYDNFAHERHAWAIGATLDWVIYDGGARDTQRHFYTAALAEARARAEVLGDSIRDNLANGRNLVTTKQSARQTAERSVMLAQETVDLTRTQYEVGSVTQIDLLTAQDALVAAQDALARAHFEVAIADLTLRRAEGTFPPR